MTTHRPIRVRFAPSPTGYLHIGGARTALFNWLFARHQGGAFLLRIEDTDTKRSDSAAVDQILESLRWLQLDWDEGPFYQSQNMERHCRVCVSLLQQGKAYLHFEDGRDGPSDYRHFRDLPQPEVERRKRRGEPFVVRFKVPAGEVIRFEDQVFGTIKVATTEIEDFVILRSDGKPTYHLSVVADDIEMKISHVIRGADHLSNTAKHLLLFQALGAPIPRFAHLPLILGPDKKRLSKRHGATSVTEYREQGIVADSLLNYLALLGWSSGEDREIFSRSELIERFDLPGINKANAIFDAAKLEWMNGHYITSLPVHQLASLVKPFLQKAEAWKPEWEKGERDWFYAFLGLLKSRCRTLVDFVQFGKPFYCDCFEYQENAVQRYLSPPDAASRKALLEGLKELKSRYSQLSDFNLEETEKALREVAEKRGLKTGNFIGAVRTATTGSTVAPGIFEVMVTLGRAKTIERLDRVIRFLQ